MKVNSLIISMLLVSIFNSKSIAQNTFKKWKIDKVLTNYVQKGDIDSDYFKPPTNLKRKEIAVLDNKIVIDRIRANYVGSYLQSEFGDTLLLEKKIYFKSRKDDLHSKKYPGDEISECSANNIDTCYLSNSFFDLLDTKEDVITAYLSMKGLHSEGRCYLFIIERGKRMVLYSENDMLLLFLKKKKR